MMTKSVCVLENNEVMPVFNWNGQRVVTYEDIDRVHHRPEGTARRAFSANRVHFRRGVDFETLSGDTYRKFIRDNYGDDYVKRGAPLLNVFTETGYLMLVKTFTDDLAWDVQRMLIKCYFNEGIRVGTTMIDDIASKWKEVFQIFHDQILEEARQQARDMFLQLSGGTGLPVQAMVFTPAGNITKDDLTASAVAVKYGWYTAIGNPHYRFVSGLRKDAGIYVNTAEAHDTEYVKYSPMRSSVGSEQVNMLAYFTPEGQRKLKEHWDKTHHERFHETFYRRETVSHRAGTRKSATYMYGGKNYEIYDKHNHLIAEEQFDLFKGE